MDSEILAAAERVLRVIRNLDAISDVYGGTESSQREQCDDDVIAVAQAVLGSPSSGALKIAPHPGFRYFRCDGCEHEWIEPSRDATSPSGEDCRCGEWCMASEATTAQYDRLRQQQCEAMERVLRNIVECYDMASELYTSDEEMADSFADKARAALAASTHSETAKPIGESK